MQVWSGIKVGKQWIGLEVSQALRSSAARRRILCHIDTFPMGKGILKCPPWLSTNGHPSFAISLIDRIGCADPLREDAVGNLGILLLFQ